MADRKRTVGPSQRIADIPPVSVNTGLEGSLAAIGQSFFRAGDYFQAQEDERNTKLGKTAGGLAAMNQNKTVNGVELPQYIEMPGTDAYAKAFNRQQLTIYRSRLEQNIRNKASELALTHPNDPNAMMQGMEAYVGGVSTGIAPEILPEVKIKSQELMRPFAAAAWKKILERQQKSVGLALDAAEGAELNNAQLYGAQSVTGDEAAVAATNELGKIMGAFYQRTLNAIDGVAVTKGEAMDRVQKYQSAFAKRVLMGMFDGSTDKQGMFAKLTSGNIRADMPIMQPNGKVAIVKNVDVSGILSQKDRAELRTYMDVRFKSILSAQTRAREAFDRAKKLAADEEADHFLSRFYPDPNVAKATGQPPTPRPTYEEILNSKNMTIEQKRSFLKILDAEIKGPHGRINATYNDLYMQIATGQIKSDEMTDKVLPFISNGIGTEDYKTLFDWAKTVEKDQEGQSLKNFLKAAHAQISKQTLLLKDPRGEEMFYTFTQDFARRVRQEREKGVPLADLLNPRSPAYLGTMIQSGGYIRTQTEILRDMGDRTRKELERLKALQTGGK